jgi:Cof subfamily protein (haloacid dehalogenase superfamily)
MSLIAIDLDGTLINTEHKISKENIKAIKKAQELGHEVVIATGRAHFDVQSILKEEGLSLYTVGANGATVHSPAGTSILSVPMQGDKVKEIVKVLDKENIYYEVYSDDGIYTRSYAKNILLDELASYKENVPEDEFAFMENQYEKQTGQFGYIYKEEHEELYTDKQLVYNINVFSFDNEKRLAVLDKFKDANDLTIVQSLEFNFELEHVNASKGKAITYLAKVLGMDIERSMAIGDSGNDISMLEVVSDSFAMGNANDLVKAHAKYVTDTNDKNGVAKAIYRFLDIEE